MQQSQCHARRSTPETERSDESGADIATRASAEWLTTSDRLPSATDDRNAAIIADTLSDLANSGKLMIPQGGYIVRRGLGRVIVERPEVPGE